MEVARLTTTFDTKGTPAVMQATKQVESALQRVGDMGARAGNLIKLAFGAVVVGQIGKMAAGFLSLNANAEQYAISLETVTQSQTRANQLMADLQKFAATTPFEFPELVQAAINLEAFGIKTEDWLETIGNTASAMNKSVDQVTQAVLDATTGEYERLKELGIKARIEGDKVVLAYRDQTVEIDKNNKERIASTIQGFWNKGYAGAMKRQSKTFNGMLSTLRDNWNMTMQRLTRGFFGFSKGVIAEANNFFNRLNAKLDQGLSLWGALLSSLHVTLDKTFGKDVGDAVNRFLRSITRGAVLLKDFASGLIDAFAAGKSAAAIANTLPEPFQRVATAIFSIADAVGDLWRGFQVGGVGEFLSRLGEELGQILSAGVDLSDEAIDVTVRVGKWIITQAESLYDKLSRWAFAAAGGNELVGDATGGPEPMGAGIPIGNLAVTIGGWIVEKGKQAISLAQAVAIKVSTWIISLKDDVADTARTIASFAVNIGSWVIDKAPNAISFAQAVAMKVSSWIIDLKNQADENIPKITNYAVNIASIAVKDILGWAADATATIQTWLDDNAPGDLKGVVNLSEISVAFAEGSEGKWGDALKTLLTADPINITPKIELDIETAVENWVRNFKAPNLDKSWLILVPMLFVNLPATIQLWVAKNLAPDIAKALRAGFEGAMAGAFEGSTTFEEAGPFGEFVPTTTPGLVSGLSDRILGWFQEMADKITTGIGNIDLFGSVKTWIGDQVTGLTDYIGGLKPPSLPKFITNPIGWIEDQISGGSSTEGERTGSGGPGGTLDQGLKSRGAFGGMVDQLVGREGNGKIPFPSFDTTDLVTSLGDAETESHSTVTYVSGQLSWLSGRASIHIGTFVQAIADGFRRFQFDATTITNTTSIAVTAGFASMRANAIAQSSALVAGVIGALSVLPGFGIGIGQSLGFGIASGINSTIGAVAASAANLVSQAVVAARNAAQISSPSRVMMELGGYMAEGFALGIQRGTPSASRSLAHLVATPSYARSGGYGGMRSGPTYVIQGNVIGRDVEGWIRRKIENGAARTLDGRIASWQRGEV